MSENNVIYEITQQMNNSQNIQRDMTEAIEMITSLFKKKYINRLQEAIQAQHIQTKKNPTKEIQLLHALKPFMDKSMHSQIDKMINTMMTFNTIKTIQKDIYIQQGNYISTQSNKNFASEKDESIKADGIYDVDENCLSLKSSKPNTFNSNAMLMFLLLFSNIQL